jgi:hypothetical protein
MTTVDEVKLSCVSTAAPYGRTHAVAFIKVAGWLAVSASFQRLIA